MLFLPLPMNPSGAVRSIGMWCAYYSICFFVFDKLIKLRSAKSLIEKEIGKIFLHNFHEKDSVPADIFSRVLMDICDRGAKYVVVKIQMSSTRSKTCFEWFFNRYFFGFVKIVKYYAIVQFGLLLRVYIYSTIHFIIVFQWTL